MAVPAAQGQAELIRDVEEYLGANAPVLGVVGVLAGGSRINEILLVAVAVVEEGRRPEGDLVLKERNVDDAATEPLLPAPALAASSLLNFFPSFMGGVGGVW